MNTGRMFTPKEIAKCAKEALENWDFDVMEESPEYIEAYKEALNFDEEYAEMFCDDGQMDMDSAYKDIWDFLDEFALNMAAAS